MRLVDTDRAPAWCYTAAAFSEGKLLSALSLEDVVLVVGLGTGIQLAHTSFMVVSLMGWLVGRARVNS